MARPTAPRVRTHTATLVLVLVGLLSLCMVGACTAPGAEPSDQEAENPSRSSQTLGNADVTGPTGAAIADAVGAFLAQDSTRGYDAMRLAVWVDDQMVLAHPAGSLDDSENVASVTKSVIGLLVGSRSTAVTCPAWTPPSPSSCQGSVTRWRPGSAR